MTRLNGGFWMADEKKIRRLQIVRSISFACALLMAYMAVWMLEEGRYWLVFADVLVGWLNTNNFLSARRRIYDLRQLGSQSD